MIKMFAVKRVQDKETVDPHTISTSERGAKVLWLENHTCIVKNSVTDNHVDIWFSNMSKINKVEVVEIEIKIKEG